MQRNPQKAVSSLRGGTDNDLAHINLGRLLVREPDGVAA